MGSGSISSEARHRAHALMRELLSDAEYEAIVRHGYLDTPSPRNAGVIYRIPRGPGFVRVFYRGRAIADLCVQPAEPLPDDDVVVMHKLLIQANEDDYLAVANRFPPWPVNIPTVREIVRNWRGDLAAPTNTISWDR